MGLEIKIFCHQLWKHHFKPLRGRTFPSIQAKAARLCYGLVKNHAMLDGNKRIGVHAMLVFLALNGYELVYTQAELIDIILSLADGKVEYEELLQWIINHQK